MSADNGSCKSRTVLWCTPRTISTAFTKCLSAIEGNEIWFEPYCYSYVAKVEVALNLQKKIPTEYNGNEEIFQQAADLVRAVAGCEFPPERLSYSYVKQQLESSTSPHVFLKDMAFSITNDEHKLLPDGFKHTFLIRNPVRAINSYRKAMHAHFSMLGLLTGDAANERTYDIQRDDRYFAPGSFVKEQWDLWKYVRENIDSDPIVIDADDLLTKPAETLKKYCVAVGLPYDESLLQWDAATDVIKTWKMASDGILASVLHLYGTAMKSSRFFPASPEIPRDQLTPDVIRCSDQVMKYFEEMYETRIKV